MVSIGDLRTIFRYLLETYFTCFSWLSNKTEIELQKHLNSGIRERYRVYSYTS